LPADYCQRSAHGRPAFPAGSDAAAVGQLKGALTRLAFLLSRFRPTR
jgi:hypothetical protein